MGHSELVRDSLDGKMVPLAIIVVFFLLSFC